MASDGRELSLFSRFGEANLQQKFLLLFIGDSLFCIPCVVVDQVLIIFIISDDSIRSKKLADVFRLDVTRISPVNPFEAGVGFKLYLAAQNFF